MLNDKYKDTELKTGKSNLQLLAKDTTNKDVFGMIGYLENGILRINDKGAAKSNNETILTKLYSFINKAEDTDSKYAKACPNECNIMSYLGGGSSGCSGCSTKFEFNGNDYDVMFDENGNLHKAVARRTYYEPDISEEIVINSDMTISDKLFYENGDVAVDMTCGFNDSGRCLGYNELASYDDVNRTPTENRDWYTEYFDAVLTEQIVTTDNPLFGKNINATSYYQNGNVAFEFEQKDDGSVKQTIYDKNKEISTIQIGNVSEGKYCIYGREQEPQYQGNACDEYRSQMNIN